MSTSDMQGYINVSTTAFAGNAPVDAGVYQDFIDSMRHLYDEYAQVRVAMPAHSTRYLTTQTPANTSTYYPITTLAQFPIQLREDGASFRVRTRLFAASSGGASVTFRVVLAPVGQSARVAQTTISMSSVAEGSTTSTSSIEITLSSNILFFSGADIAAAQDQIKAYDDVAGADDVTVDGYMVELSVWAKTANVSSLGRLFGCNAAEYVGL